MHHGSARLRASRIALVSLAFGSVFVVSQTIIAAYGLTSAAPQSVADHACLSMVGMPSTRCQQSRGWWDEELLHKFSQ
jgi:hypothetical protein